MATEISTVQPGEAGLLFGSVFKITSTGTLTVLHDMNGSPDGSNTFAGLVQATDGNFYGANQSGGNGSNCSDNCGTLFQVTPAGGFTVIHTFENNDGAYPVATLFQHTNGILYGATNGGGITTGSCAPFGCGVFYSLNNSLPAFVSLVPYQGKVGSFVEILGQGFTSSTTVSFNGTPATATVVSGTYLKAFVPSGATTGFVTVTTSSGTLTSNRQFLVVP